MLVKDQLDRTITISQAPKRIASLVPSQTELLVDLGLEQQLVGITKFCVHPAHLKSQIEVVGGTKKVHFDKIEKLQPNIIICNKEENTKEMVSQLEEIAPVWISDVQSFSSSLDLIDSLGAIFSVEAQAQMLRKKIEGEFQSFSVFMKDKPKRKVAYLIWKNPYMAAGRKTFINEILRLNNWENFIADPNSRYPEIELNSLQQADLVLLSTEPYPFKEADVIEIKNALQKEVHLVNGEYFSWYGSRLQHAFSYFKALQTQL